MFGRKKTMEAEQMHVELWMIHTNDGLCEVLATYFFRFSLRERERNRERGVRSTVMA